ncbi:LysR family transcriptional regulator [Mesorhizobium sp. B3-2-1]|uniref:LysR family transcriptional regulator n=1 Tax=Mesorhizobium sp. B3-2-1 TaxID=2589891 RepID=UPI001FED8665|nr:LysR family transcriptional regulator [Mesorhizobium sp. B3-2-1]
MNLNALDLNLVRVLDALLRERSVTRAGEQIGLSQPAVSAALNRLRHVLNDQLFVRHGNDIVPTPRAESLAEPVRAALREIERVFQTGKDFDPAGLERTFTFMGADFFSMLLMPPLAARIAAVAPGVSFRFLDSARGDVSRLLQDDEIDAALERPRSGGETTSQGAAAVRQHLRQATAQLFRRRPDERGRPVPTRPMA